MHFRRFFAGGWEMNAVAVLLSVLCITVACAAVVYARVQNAPKFYVPLTSMLDLLDHRYRSCATLRLLAAAVAREVGSLPVKDLPCDQVTQLVDVRKVFAVLPSSLYATAPGFQGLLSVFLNGIAAGRCRGNGTIDRDELAAGVVQAAEDVCRSPTFRREYA